MEASKIAFGSLVSFGDSLSDVGTYAVGAVAMQGGGKFTVNAPSTRIWIELLARQLDLPAPCPAMTGLDGDAEQGYSVMPPREYSFCSAYGQGGSRVTNPLGIGNKQLGGGHAVMGYLTVPVSAQIDLHLARHSRFSANEIVFVQAGGNDLFNNFEKLSGSDAISAMQTAGEELAKLVNAKILGKGARYVVVVNLPDVSVTPFALNKEASKPGSQSLINQMVTYFNEMLRLGLAGKANVILVDAYTVSRNQSVNPAQYGLIGVLAPICQASPTAPIAVGSSLTCTSLSLIPGASEKNLYSDLVHPTPYGHRLLAQLVATEMAKHGWL